MLLIYVLIAQRQKKITKKSVKKVNFYWSVEDALRLTYVSFQLFFCSESLII